MPHQILVVDDSATIRKAIDITFAHEDFELTTVSDGPSALEAISQKVPDLALVDANLGQENGVALARDLLAMAPGQAFPLVLMSSNQSPVDPDALESAGITSQLTKPFHTQELIDHVKTLLGLEVKKSVAAMRFVPRAARAQAEETMPVITEPAPAPPNVSMGAPPPVIKGPPPPAIKGPPPPAPSSPVQLKVKPEVSAPALITAPPTEADIPLPALITPPPAELVAPVLIPPPPEEQVAPAAIITPPPPEPEAPAPVLITAPPEQDQAPVLPDFDAPTVIDVEPAAAQSAPPPLDIPEILPIPVPEAPTMVVRTVQDEPYRPEPTHSVPALTLPVTDLGLGIDLAGVSEDLSSDSGKIELADGEIDLDALMPVIEAAVRKVTAEVVERVVWEVVPDLAERLIREHLKSRSS